MVVLVVMVVLVAVVCMVGISQTPVRNHFHRKPSHRALLLESAVAFMFSELVAGPDDVDFLRDPFLVYAFASIRAGCLAMTGESFTDSWRNVLTSRSSSPLSDKSGN